MARPSRITAATWASLKTVVARSSGSSASTGTYAAPATRTAAMATYSSVVPERIRTPTRSPLPTPTSPSSEASSPACSMQLGVGEHLGAVVDGRSVGMSLGRALQDVDQRPRRRGAIGSKQRQDVLASTRSTS